MGKLKDEDIISPNGGLYNTISANTVIVGNISSETDFRMDGMIEGDIACKGKLIIGPKAKVSGKIEAGNMEVLGEIKGTIITEKLLIKSTGTIKGDIIIKSLEIEPNAQFDGTCTMSNEKKA